MRVQKKDSGLHSNDSGFTYILFVPPHPSSTCIAARVSLFKIPALVAITRRNGMLVTHYDAISALALEGKSYDLIRKEYEECDDESN